MFDSIKDWLNVPIQINKFVKRDGDGVKQTGDVIDTYCCPYSEYKVITNFDGAEVVSKHQVYVAGSVNVEPKDTLLFEQVVYTIQHIGTFYKDGVPDLKVVYL